MNKVTKVAKLSEGALGALDTLKVLGAKGAVTAKDLKDAGLEGLNSAHLPALVNRGLVDTADVEVEVVTVVKRKVKAYTLTDAGKEFKGE
jgi:hypothetical protein